jgi:hypothetical protein
MPDKLVQFEFPLRDDARAKGFRSGGFTWPRALGIVLLWAGAALSPAR